MNCSIDRSSSNGARMNQRQTILQMTLILSYTVSLSTGRQLIKLFCYFSIYVDLKLSTALLHLSFYSYFILDSHFLTNLIPMSIIPNQQNVNVRMSFGSLCQSCTDVQVPGDDERENQHLQHPHQQLTRKLKVLHLLSG